MKIKLEIQVADSFVLKHMDDSPLPVEAIIAKIDNKFDIRVEESTFSSAIILVNEEDVEKIQKLVLEFVKRKYNEKNPSGVVELIIDEEIDIDDILMDFDDIIDGDSDKEKDEVIVPTAPVKTELESLKKINQLLGCEEFKRLASDIASLSAYIPSEVLNSKEFSNARFVRNLYERTWAKAVMRCQLEKLDEITLTRDDFARSSSDKEFSFIMKKKKARIGF